MHERFYKVVGKVLKLWERLYCREKVGKVSKFQERLFNDNFKAGNGEERKGKGKLSVPPPNSTKQKYTLDPKSTIFFLLSRIILLVQILQLVPNSTWDI